VRCVRGRIFDIGVDVRKGSPTYGQWKGAELSAEKGEQLYIPVGFAHGFFTIEPDTEVVYKVTAYYAPECDGGIRWSDPAIGIEWPDVGSETLVSDKDAVLPLLSDFDSPFEYDGTPLSLTMV
jgi:dTDP-4-dehydrorhamnose 3,5-epimerase